MFNQVKKLTRHVKRVGCIPQKVLFAIYCHEITFLPNESKIRDGSILSVCFERGGKLSSSPDRMFTSGAHEKVFYVNEPLNLVATVYKDVKTGRYQEKSGKVILRELANNKFGGTSYIGIGVAALHLNEYVPTEEDQTSSQIEISLKLDKIKAIVRITISAQIISGTGSEDMDDTMSVLSSSSDRSEISASFDSEPFHSSSIVSPSNGSSISTSSSFGTLRRNGSGIGKKSWKDSMIVKEETIPEDEEVEEDETTTFASITTKSIENIDKENHEKYVNSEGSGNKMEPKEITWGLTKSITSSSSNNNNSRDNDLKEKKMTLLMDDSMNINSKNIAPEVSEETDTMSSVILTEKIPLSQLRELKDHGRNIDSESLEVLLRLETLRQENNEKDQLITSLRNQLQEQTITSQQQLLSVRKELNIAKEAVKREQLARETIATATLKADTSLGHALAQAREETAYITAEYAQVAAELEAAKEIVQKYKDEMGMMQDRIDEAMEATHMAANAATLARLKLSEREMEYEELIDELIATKMNCANYATDYEEERRRNILERRKLQKYAERVAVLEVHIAMTSALANTKQQISSDPME